MCLSNEQILEILAIQKRRKQARIRYAMTMKDGYGRLLFPTKEAAAVFADKFRKEISYERSVSPDAWKICYGSWHHEKPDIVKTRCPIPHFPPMPLTVCLRCKSTFRLKHHWREVEDYEADAGSGESRSKGMMYSEQEGERG